MPVNTPFIQPTASYLSGYVGFPGVLRVRGIQDLNGNDLLSSGGTDGTAPDRTYNASLATGATNVAKINQAISNASASGFSFVWIPASMLPYAAGSVSFNSSIGMMREGQNPAYVDVIAYGAFNDGNGTPSTTAINSAISRAARVLALGGFFNTIGVPAATVYFPPGNYQLDGPIKVPDGVRLLGDGIRGTTITPKSNFAPMNDQNGMIMNTDPNQQHFYVEFMELNGFNTTSGSTNAVNGIVLDGAGQPSYIRNVAFNHFGDGTHMGFAIKLKNTGITQSGLLLENLNINDISDDGIKIDAVGLRLNIRKVHGVDCGVPAGKAVIKGPLTTSDIDYISFEASSNATQRYGLWLTSPAYGNTGRAFVSTGDHNSGSVLVQLDSGTGGNSFYHLTQPNLSGTHITVQDAGAGQEVTVPVTIKKAIVHAYTQLSAATTAGRDGVTVFADRDSVWTVGSSSITWRLGDPPNILYDQATLTSVITVKLQGKTGTIQESFGWPEVTVTRTSGGSSLVVVDSQGPITLKSIATGQWGTFKYNSANSWYLKGFGSL